MTQFKLAVVVGVLIALYGIFFLSVVMPHD